MDLLDERIVSRVAIITLLLSFTTAAAQGDVDLEEVKERLRQEQELNLRQTERIRELELALFSVIETQESERNQAALEAEIESVVDRVVDDRMSALSPTAPRSRLTIRGQGRFVVRAFGGGEISTDESFELEHLIVQFTLKLDDDFSLKATPAVSHRGDLALITAYLDWTPDERFGLRAGRFLIPGNGVHAWAWPSDSFIEPYLPENSPRPFLYAPYWDEGVMIKGRLSLGSPEAPDLRYHAWVINGFDASGLDGFHKRNIGDNNQNKTIGARLALDIDLSSDARLHLGLGGQYGKYDDDDRLKFLYAEFDAELVWGPLALYAEVFYRETEIEGSVMENPAATLQEVQRLIGIKIRPRLRLAENLVAYAQFDYLEARQPPRQGGQFSVLSLDDESFGVSTWLVGLEYEVTPYATLFLEGGFFDRDLGSDIPFISAGIYTTF